MLAEARVSWGFLPPDTKPEDASKLVGELANGIWIGDAADEHPVLDEEESDAELSDDDSAELGGDDSSMDTSE